MLPAEASILKRTDSPNPMAEARGLRAEDFGQLRASSRSDWVVGGWVGAAGDDRYRHISY
jgi:hypothetical protein